MTRKRLRRSVAALVAVGLVAAAAFAWRFSRQINITPARSPAGEATLTLPPGFSATVFASGLNGPRFMAVGPEGDLYVADRRAGRIVALPDADGDGVADSVRVVAADLNQPHSLVYHDGAWYVGEPGAVIRLVDSNGDGVADSRSAVVDDLPAGGSHTTRTVAFLPDGRMVVSIGSSCNICDEDDPRRAAVVVYDGPDGGGERVLARGLRNAVGLALQPGTGLLWASNNGRDLMGDDLPPETIYIVEDGADYGWPDCHAGTIVDPDRNRPDACVGVAQPQVTMQAHSAPLGLTFYDGDRFPEAYQGDLFVAFHGSWNRSVPTGYKIVRLDFADGELVSAEPTDFATGWLDPAADEAAGRPVDVTVGSDGALYISDDKAGFIYRIAYTGG